MFFVWGVTQPLNIIITQKLFSWLPSWYTVQDINGYSKQAILITLVLNLLLNGFLAPIVEEYYFRVICYPQRWGKWAFVLSAVLFSYHSNHSLSNITYCVVTIVMGGLESRKISGLESILTVH
jgi:membrane protease YdiL (CAAX protease family)